MQANIFKIKRQGASFAELIATNTSIAELCDDVIYVLDAEEEWKSACAKINDSFANSEIKQFWHTEFAFACISTNDLLLPTEIAERISDGCNLLMPLNTPDRTEKVYFVGKSKSPQELELITALMTIDAQAIEDECSLYAFVNSFNMDVDNAREIWTRMIDTFSQQRASAGNISFRGKYSHAPSRYPFFHKSVHFPKFEKKSYEDKLEKIRNLSKAISLLKNSNEEVDIINAEKDFQYACEALKDSEKNELIFELAKKIPADDFQQVWDSVTNREQKGMKSSAQIKVCFKRVTESTKTKDKFQGDLRTYMLDAEGKHHLLNFANNSAHVIYIMNLILRKRSGAQPHPLDIRKNKDAFIKTYNLIYGGDAEKEFDKLMCKISATEIDFEGRAKSRCFNSIANCLYEICSELRVDPSPYVVDDERPLTINPALINIEINEDVLNKIAFV